MNDKLDQLQRKVQIAVVSLAHELVNNDDAEGVLPIDEITVKQTIEGVVVKFMREAAKKPKLVKPSNES